MIDKLNLHKNIMYRFRPVGEWITTLHEELIKLLIKEIRRVPVGILSIGLVLEEI